jgi:SAM-dependent methyltransferase
MTTLNSPRLLSPSETYTPGHRRNAINFMAERSLFSHGHFVAPWLRPGDRVLDAGCGPGTITLGLADAVFPGQVIGLDANAESVSLAERLAWGLEQVNASFQTGQVYALPFSDESFDLIFSHALFEHLAQPQAAVRELRRVLKPGGVLALCSPDWNRFQIQPFSSELQSALACYRQLQHRNGGDTTAGWKLASWVRAEGLVLGGEETRWECYPQTEKIGEYLAQQLEREGEKDEAETWRRWSQSPTASFAQAWTSVIALRPKKEEG